MKLFWKTVAGVFALDQFTKYLVINNIALGSNINLSILKISHIQNTGISFGMFQGYPNLMIYIMLAVIFFIFYSYEELASSTRSTYAIGAIIGGAFGNLLDRILIGAVTDFIDFGWWPAFNIADTAICVGALILFLELRD